MDMVGEAKQPRIYLVTAAAGAAGAAGGWW